MSKCKYGDSDYLEERVKLYVPVVFPAEEIARLKKELEAVTHERDIFRKMVDNAGKYC